MSKVPGMNRRAAAAPPSGTPTADDSALPSSGGTREGAGAPEDGIHSGQADGAADPWRDPAAPPPDRAELGPRYDSLVAYPGPAQNAPRPDRDQGELDAKRNETDGDKLALEAQD